MNKIVAINISLIDHRRKQNQLFEEILKVTMNRPKRRIEVINMIQFLSPVIMSQLLTQSFRRCHTNFLFINSDHFNQIASINIITDHRRYLNQSFDKVLKLIWISSFPKILISSWFHTSSFYPQIYEFKNDQVTVLWP